MTKVKIRFKCGYEEERDDWATSTSVLRNLIKESHKMNCDCINRK